MLGGNVPDKLLDNHCLADTSTTIGANLTPLGERGNKVNNLKPCLKQLGKCFLFLESGWGAMN